MKKLCIITASILLILSFCGFSSIQRYRFDADGFVTGVSTEDRATAERVVADYYAGELSIKPHDGAAVGYFNADGEMLWRTPR